MQFLKAILPAVVAGVTIVEASLPARAAVVQYTDAFH
jgi:hypothetical protein